MGLKRKLITFFNKFLFLLQKQRNKVYPFEIITQTFNYKSIPIIIISFNQLYYLQQLINFLRRCKYSNIVIIDNNSTYPPLIKYLDSLEPKISIYRLKTNLGHLAFWKNSEIYQKYSKGYYVITDPDIVPGETCPPGFLKYFKRVLYNNKKITKVGFSLKLDDIPVTNPNREKVMAWESQFWQEKDEDGNYKAGLDTTFALYRPGYIYNEKNFFNSIRTRKPYEARHGGWYLDINNLSEEQIFYYSKCNESSAWRIDPTGKLINEYLKDINLEKPL